MRVERGETVQQVARDLGVHRVTLASRVKTFRSMIGPLERESLLNETNWTMPKNSSIWLIVWSHVSQSTSVITVTYDLTTLSVPTEEMAPGYGECWLVAEGDAKRNNMTTVGSHSI